VVIVGLVGLDYRLDDIEPFSEVTVLLVERIYLVVFVLPRPLFVLEVLTQHLVSSQEVGHL